jgi:hypothetical protein
MFQSLWNLMDRATDAFVGRFSSLDEVLKSVVESAEFRVDGFMHKECYCYHDYHKQLENFLVHQLVLLCEAKSILRVHSVLEILGNREFMGQEVDREVLTDEQKRAARVYSAMRHEFDKRKNSESDYPIFHYAFRSALQDMTSISGMDSEERKYLGFNIFEEYHKILPTVLELDHNGIKSFYSDYMVKIHNKAFHCFMTEEDRLAEESCQREQASFAGKIVRFKPTAERLESLRFDWRTMVYDTYRSDDITMSRIRLTDISKDFVKLF